MTAVVSVLCVVVVLLAVLLVSLLRSHAEILRALHDMGVDLDPSRPGGGTVRAASSLGSAAPDRSTVDGVAEPDSAGAPGRRAADVAGPTPGGDAVVVGVGPAAATTILAFLSTGCTTCRNYWSAFADGVHLDDGERLVVVTRGEEAESPSTVAELAAGVEAVGIPVVMSSDAWEDYDVPVAPYVVRVEGDVVVGEGAAATWEQVRTLLERSRRDLEHVRNPGGARSSRRALLTGGIERVDADLAAAGLRPGDPRLHQDSLHQGSLHDDDLPADETGFAR